MAKYTFQLMRGRHVEGRTVKNEQGEIVSRPKVYVHNEDNIIETDTELDKLFGPEKFQRITNASAATNPDPFVPKDVHPLERLKKDELIAYAEDNEIDLSELGESPTKARILALVLSHESGDD